MIRSLQAIVALAFAVFVPGCALFHCGNDCGGCTPAGYGCTNECYGCRDQWTTCRTEGCCEPRCEHREESRFVRLKEKFRKKEHDEFCCSYAMFASGKCPACGYPEPVGATPIPLSYQHRSSGCGEQFVGRHAPPPVQGCAAPTPACGCTANIHSAPSAACDCQSTVYDGGLPVTPNEMVPYPVETYYGDLVPGGTPYGEPMPVPPAEPYSSPGAAPGPVPAPRPDPDATAPTTYYVPPGRSTMPVSRTAAAEPLIEAF